MTRHDGGDPRAARRVFFDGGCPVCRREIGWYRKMRGADAIGWVDITGDAALPEGADRDALMKRFTIERRDGAMVSGGPAFVSLWRGLAPIGWAGRILDRQPFLWLAERAYRGFLRLRSLWR